MNRRLDDGIETASPPSELLRGSSIRRAASAAAPAHRIGLGEGGRGPAPLQDPLVLLDGQRDDHVLHPHRLDVLEGPSHACLLQLVNLQLLGDQPEDGDVVGLEVFHADGVGPLLVLLLPRLVGVLLVLGHLCQYLLDAPLPVPLLLLPPLDEEVRLHLLLLVVILKGQSGGLVGG